jgi:hypothetical protein
MTAKMAKRSARARERHRHGSSSLKVLDPERPIREAGMNHGLSFVGESAADFGSVELLVLKGQLGHYLSKSKLASDREG